MAARRVSIGVILALALVGSLAVVACGARSELGLEGQPEGIPVDGGVGGNPQDASTDAPADAPVDAPEDAPIDGPIECEDPATTYIYLITSQTILVSFRPEVNQFFTVGSLNCPGTNSTPFSMAVDFTGIAYVLYLDGQLFRVSTADATCESTNFQPFPFGDPSSFGFGMGFQRDANGMDETLYIADINTGGPSQGLGMIDTSTLAFSYIGPFSQNPGNSIELTPTGPGPLWGYFLNVPSPGGTLVEIDTANANIVQTYPASPGNNSSALAVAWWGGAFYVFTSSAVGTDVTRIDTMAMTESLVAQYNNTVVGAGVSTCAPVMLP